MTALTKLQGTSPAMQGAWQEEAPCEDSILATSFRTAPAEVPEAKPLMVVAEDGNNSLISELRLSAASIE
eukprot:CAMPEP_0183421856 /NCGR_PEP_ID=MMETSP0370-20130417/27399_1 /TAXON_ID=268820 /ORGANISM="Peridinium aciculiferum, Strain PAER-2" /LENGTH=69 /DNA_ID=CAMNT_0025605893 /DNA_START=19 /DNA_END=228 /DNA_ORIENTATION=+